jgi:hypothetical protein
MAAAVSQQRDGVKKAMREGGRGRRERRSVADDGGGMSDGCR